MESINKSHIFMQYFQYTFVAIKIPSIWCTYMVKSLNCAWYSFCSVAHYLIKILLLGGIVPLMLFFFIVSLISITFDSLLTIFHPTAIPHPLSRNILVIIRLRFIILSILVTLLPTNPVSHDQDPIIPVFSIRNLS